MGFFDKLKKKSGLSIQEAALSVATMIGDISVNAGELLSQEFGKASITNERKIDESTVWEVTFEFHFLFIHITDRKALKFLDSKKRQQFIDLLVENISDLTLNAAMLGPENEKVEKLVESYFDSLIERNEDYAKYERIIAEDYELLEGTLIWEFGKKVSSIITGSDDPKVTRACINAFVKTWPMMKLDEILENIR